MKIFYSAIVGLLNWIFFKIEISFQGYNEYARIKSNTHYGELRNSYVPFYLQYDDYMCLADA